MNPQTTIPTQPAEVGERSVVVPGEAENGLDAGGRVAADPAAISVGAAAVGHADATGTIIAPGAEAVAAGAPPHESGPADDGLEQATVLSGLLPIRLPRTSCSAEAESVLRKLGRMCTEADPWLPVGAVGPLVVFGHHRQDAQDFWGVPSFLSVRVQIGAEQYEKLLEDFLRRLQYKPVEPSNPVAEAIQPPPKAADLHDALQWFIENYPMEAEEKENFEKIAKENASVDLESFNDFKNIPRHYGPAMHYFVTGEAIFNPEEAPAQERFPDQLLEKHCVYPMFIGEKRIYLLSPTKSVYGFEDEWVASGNDPFEFIPVIADADAIRSAIGRNRGRNTSYADVDVGDLYYSDNTNLVEIDPLEMGQINPANPNNTPEQMIHWVLYTALSMRGSDLHVEKYYNTARFRARIDGSARVIYSAPEEMLPRFIALIKNYSNMGHQHQDLQDARFAMSIGKRRVDVRVSAVPCRKQNQKLTMRFLDKQDGIKQLSELNMSSRQLDIVNSTMQRDQGLVLVTGPTGSGKTTTLYAFINSINEDSINIHTIEDPIEYEIEGINQTQIDEFNGINFATGLRALLRADPDVILVGESRDEETATASINAALTGHLVLTTLHANDSLRAVSRLIYMGVEPYLLSDALALSQAQRLAKRLCNYCKRPVPAPRELQEFFYQNKVITEPLKDPIFVAQGCDECHGSGYSGRVALMEMCPVSGELSEMIAEGASMSDMRKAAARIGVLSLYQEGMVQVVNGNTTMDQINKLAHMGAMV
ncbi:MAG: GspE/PulE family protein [Verrucomicrobiota bacterium]